MESFFSTQMGSILSNYFLPLIIFLLICIIAASNFSTANKIENNKLKSRENKRSRRPAPTKKMYKAKKQKISFRKPKKKSSSDKSEL